MNGSAFLLIFAAGWMAGQVWSHRVAVGDAIEAALDWLLSDPVPPRPLGPARSHVHLVRRGDEDGGGAA